VSVPSEVTDPTADAPVPRKSTAVGIGDHGLLRELLVLEHARTDLQLPAGTVVQCGASGRRSNTD
jgi:hypothetical protein